MKMKETVTDYPVTHMEEMNNKFAVSHTVHYLFSSLTAKGSM